MDFNIFKILFLSLVKLLISAHSSKSWNIFEIPVQQSTYLWNTLYLAVRPAAVMVELPVAPPTVPVAPEFCWGSIINESKLIIPDIFDAEFGPGLFAWAPPAAPDDLDVGIGPAPKLFTLKYYKVKTKEILESFLFCMYFGFLPLHNAKSSSNRD